MEDFSGKILLRMPKDLHRKLSLAAQQNNVSINQFIIYLLASNITQDDLEKTEEDRTEITSLKEVNNVGQDANSGRRGNEVGRLIGEAIAKKLNISLEPGTNKGRYKDRAVVIKSTRLGNSQFGITNKMAGEIDDVILAKETSEGSFDLYQVGFAQIKSTGKPSFSKGASAGKVTNFRVAEVINNGKRIDNINIWLPYPPNSRIKTR